MRTSIQIFIMLMVYYDDVYFLVFHCSSYVSRYMPRYHGLYLYCRAMYGVMLILMAIWYALDFFVYKFRYGCNYQLFIFSLLASQIGFLWSVVLIILIDEFTLFYVIIHLFIALTPINSWFYLFRNVKLYFYLILNICIFK